MTDGQTNGRARGIMRPRWDGRIISSRDRASGGHALRLVGVRLAKFTMFVLVWSDHHLADVSQGLLIHVRSCFLHAHHHRL